MEALLDIKNPASQVFHSLIFQRALALILRTSFHPYGLAVNSRGVACSPLSGKAVGFCVQGAVCREADDFLKPYNKEKVSAAYRVRLPSLMAVLYSYFLLLNVDSISSWYPIERDEKTSRNEIEIAKSALGDLAYIIQRTDYRTENLRELVRNWDVERALSKRSDKAFDLSPKRMIVLE